MRHIYIDLDMNAIAVQSVQKSDQSGNFLSVLLKEDLPAETRELLSGAGLLVESIEECPPEMLTEEGRPVHGYLGTEPLLIPEDPEEIL